MDAITTRRDHGLVPCLDVAGSDFVPTGARLADDFKLLALRSSIAKCKEDTPSWLKSYSIVGDCED